jgi:hypothetical protein
MAENVLLEIRGDIKDIKSKFAEVESNVKKMSGTTQKQADAMSSRFQNLGNIVKGALTIGVLYKFNQGIQASIKAVSDLEEQTAKFRTVFRGSLEKANKDVEELTENYAMSTREARQNMAAIQDLLVPMGMARDKAANFSGEIVKLSADLGSFNNLPTALVMDNIASALTGQYRAMRKYGVVLLDTDVTQRVVNDGLATSKDKVTALQKAMTAYKMVLEQTQDAQGDMARTADSYANTLKRTNAVIEDLKVKIGRDLIPAQKSLLTFTSEQLIPAMESYISTIERAGEAAVKYSQGLQEAAIERQLVEVRNALIAGRISEEEATKRTQNLVKERWNLRKTSEILAEDLKKEKEEIDNATSSYNNLGNKIDDLIPKVETLTEAEEEEFKYIMGIIEARGELKGEPLLTFEGLDEETAENIIKIWKGLDKVNDDMSDLEKFTISASGAMGGFVQYLTTGEKSAYQMSRQIERLAFQLAALAAMNFIGGPWGQFAGGFLSMLGASAPAPIRQSKPKPAVQTIGQQRQNVTMSTPMYGRRFVKEMNSNAVNVNSITAWSLV